MTVARQGRRNLSRATGDFTPGDLPNLALWYDASDITTLFKDAAGTTPVTADGDVVLRINDKSPNGYNLTSASGPLYKTDKVQPSLLYSAGKYLEDTVSKTPTEIFGTGVGNYIWGVGYLTGTGFSNYISNSFTAFGFNLGTENPSKIRSGLGNGSAWADVRTAMTSIQNGVHCVAVHYDASTDDHMRYRDGVLIATLTDYWTGATGGNAADRLCLGAQSRGVSRTNYWIGDIFEAGILYNPAQDDIDSVNGYISAKYGC